MTLPDGRATAVPLLPLTLGGERPGVRLQPPQLGEHGAELLARARATATRPNRARLAQREGHRYKLIDRRSLVSIRNLDAHNLR